MSDTLRVHFLETTEPHRIKVRKYLKLTDSIKELATTHCLLICTLISENLGLEKSRSVSNLRKISGPANLDFFFQVLTKKKARFIL